MPALNRINQSIMTKKLLFLLLLFAGMANAQIVNIPDSAFKARLVASSATDVTNNVAKNFSDEWIAVDANADGEIQLTEAQAVKYLSISGILIADVTGLNSFSNLETLVITNNRLTSLNLSALTNLKAVTAANMLNLNSLNVNNLTNLTNLTCIGMTSLTALNVSSAVNLTTLSAMYCGFTTLNVNGLDSLTNLNCSGNQLTNLNGLSTSITKLDCSYNLLTNLDVSVLTNLTDLNCSGNLITSLTAPISITKLNCEYNKLATINLNELTNLSELNCGGNKLTNLNVNALTSLTILSCTHNKLTNLSISDLPNLTNLNCSNNDDLTSVTLSNLPNLEDFNVVGNMNTAVESQSGLSSLSLSGLPNLKKLDCSYGKLTTLNLSGLPSLIEVNCSSNIIASLTLTNLPNLKKLSCSRNYIINLDVSNLTNLVELGCADGYVENGQIIGRLTNLNVSGLVNLKKLYCPSNLLTTLNLTGLNNLEELNCDGMPNVRGNITSLNVNSLNNLKVLSCKYQKLTSLNVSNLANLKSLSCAANSINSLDLTGLLNLETLDYSYNDLASLNLINLPSLTELNCTYNHLVTLNVLNLTNLKTLNCSYNSLTTLNLNALTNLISLDFSYNQLTLTNVSGLSNNLKTLACASNNLSSLDVSGLTSLETLNCDSNELTNINVSSLTNLKSLNVGKNQISAIDVSNLTNLISLVVDSNQLTAIDITGLNDLIHFSCSNNQITSLDLSNHETLQSLEYSYNNLPNLDVSSLTRLGYLGCAGTQSTTLDVSNLTGLGFLYCEDNLLTTLNLNNTNMNHLRCYNNPLTTLFIKNGKNEEGLNLFPNPDLQFICADDSQIESIQTMLNGFDMNTTVCNSYCSFSPGGDYNTISGIAIFDANNDGCDITDEVNPFVKLSINSGSETGATVTNINGSYQFYTNTGNYTIAPDTENPSWFAFSPASATIPFLDNNNNVSTQNFCITAVGVHKDLEVVFAQLESARPGFDARYKLVFKNKGNQMQSGTVTLAFDDDSTDFLSATPAPDNITPNVLTWIFTNLMPFENRSIELTFNTNSPTEIPAANNGDILNFTASVTPIAGDEIPSDNQFTYNQTLVGSFDPNDIICLEGATVSPDEIGNYLHYIVNFENTGTAAAEFVVVKLEIDPNEFDVNSLQVMNASHPVLAEVKNNRVEFRFANINLQPTAGDPPVNGHGNVLFKMKSKTTLNTGDLVKNKANIFFDYNFPIETNDAETTFRTLSNPNFIADKSIVMYPNPANDFININCDNVINQIELFDIQGRLLQTSVENKNTTNLNLSDKSNGVYFIRVTTEKGLKVEKIIKQ